MLADIILLLLLFLFFCNIIVVGLFCRLMKKREANIPAQNTTKSQHKSDNQTGLGLKRRFTSCVFPYLYGLVRYDSIWMGKIPSHRVRKFMYRNILCMEIDPNAVIYGGCEIRSPWSIKIGRSTIGVGCILDGRYGIEIQDTACLGGGAKLWTAQHDPHDIHFSTEGKCGKVVLEKYTWVASNATVLPGVTVCKGAVVASGGLVTADVEAYSIVGGVPAKLIGKRREDLDYTCGGKEYWHFY